MKKGFTLIELMVVILIVAILAAVAIPILRSRIDAAKWSEGKAMIGTISTAIRAYAAEKGPTGTAPANDGFATIGFATMTDLDGTYFTNGMFHFAVTSMDPLRFTASATNPNLSPTTWTFTEDGTANNDPWSHN